MTRLILTTCSLAMLSATLVVARTEAASPVKHMVDEFEGHHYTVADRWSARFAQVTPWHGQYAYTQAGRPMALVVPPTANMRSNWSWGVAQSEIRPIHHRFARPYNGGAMSGGGYFMPTPTWPSHTDQFGVYYVRGPWE